MFAVILQSFGHNFRLRLRKPSIECGFFASFEMWVVHFELLISVAPSMDCVELVGIGALF